jgi:hypothetical protein
VRRTLQLVVAATLASVSLSGCFTGERPTLNDPPIGGIAGSPTGDVAADSVLAWLENTTRGPFTARYDTLQKASGATAVAVVTEDGGGRRASTIGGIRFLTANGTQQTCDLPTGTCETGLLDARTSDTGFTNGLESDAPARRLRISVSRKIGPTVGRTESIAGLTANCVDIPVTAEVIETFCALQNGVIARWDTADLGLTLTTFEPTATEAEFATQS